jgi:hypothetical protein
LANFLYRVQSFTEFTPNVIYAWAEGQGNVASSKFLITGLTKTQAQVTLTYLDDFSVLTYQGNLDLRDAQLAALKYRVVRHATADSGNVFDPTTHNGKTAQATLRLSSATISVTGGGSQLGDFTRPCASFWFNLSVNLQADDFSELDVETDCE